MNRTLFSLSSLSSFLFASALGVTGCADAPSVDILDETPDPADEPVLDPANASPTGWLAAAGIPITTDDCDDAAFAGATWASTTDGNFTINFLPGTAAETDKVAILARLNAAYATIRTAMGITAEPAISVYLSPSRTAALAHNRGFGRSYPSSNRYEVLYTGTADSYEIQRPGQLLTTVLDYHLDAANRTRVPLLSVGLSEYLDQSSRDHHHSYAQQLITGTETRVRVATFDTKDVLGRNYGRAGSFVKYLVERFGMPKFMEIYRATAVNWTANCYTHATHGCIGTPEQLTTMLGAVIEAKTEVSWTTVQAAWEGIVKQALLDATVALPEGDVADITNLVLLMDDGLTNNTPATYRSTMEGFYCDSGGETMRDEVAARAVNAFGTTSSQVVAIHSTGIKNFTTAQVLVKRTDSRTLETFNSFTVERFPVGWRITWGPDWY